MYLLRFFESKWEPCIWQRSYTCLPAIPHKGEIINITDNDWKPYKVTKVTYCYPEKDGESVTVDVEVEEVIDD